MMVSTLNVCLIVKGCTKGGAHVAEPNRLSVSSGK